MTKQCKPASFNAWFRDSPGHTAQALPISFGVFPVVLVVSFLIGASMTSTFTTALWWPPAPERSIWAAKED